MPVRGIEQPRHQRVRPAASVGSRYHRCDPQTAERPFGCATGPATTSAASAGKEMPEKPAGPALAHRQWQTPVPPRATRCPRRTGNPRRFPVMVHRPDQAGTSPSARRNHRSAGRGKARLARKDELHRAAVDRQPLAVAQVGFARAGKEQPPVVAADVFVAARPAQHVARIVVSVKSNSVSSSGIRRRWSAPARSAGRSPAHCECARRRRASAEGIGIGPGTRSVRKSWPGLRGSGPVSGAPADCFSFPPIRSRS
jgi:hypothetical protein